MKICVCLLFLTVGIVIGDDLIVTSDRDLCDCCDPPCCCKCAEVFIPGTPATTPPPPTTQAPECENVLDLCIILDGSGSIGSRDWANATQFVKDLVSQFNIGLDNVRLPSVMPLEVAMIEYSSDPTLQWKLSDFETSNLNVLTAVVDTIVQTKKLTNTVAALQLAVSDVFVESNGDRKDVENAVVVLTDGENNVNKAGLPAAAAALQAVAKVTAVGIASADQAELELIASGDGDEHTYFVNDFVGLFEILSDLVKDVCEEGPTTPPPTASPVPDVLQRQCVCCCPQRFYGGYEMNDGCYCN